MLNQQTLAAIDYALTYAINNPHTMNEGSDDTLEAHENFMATLRRGRDEIESLLSGESIASIWTLDDVHSANAECEIEQKSEDGEDDGLTWFHCETHDLDTLDEFYCENHPRRLTDAQAKEVLQSVERNHDAEYGINWDSIRSAIEVVVEG